MSFAYQVVDVLVAGVLAGLSSFVLVPLLGEMAVTLGVMLASMYYFSRNPYGSDRGMEYNDRIDDLYARFLP